MLNTPLWVFAVVGFCAACAGAALVLLLFAAWRRGLGDRRRYGSEWERLIREGNDGRVRVRPPQR